MLRRGHAVKEGAGAMHRAIFLCRWCKWIAQSDALHKTLCRCAHRARCTLVVHMHAHKLHTHLYIHTNVSPMTTWAVRRGPSQPSVASPAARPRLPDVAPLPA